MISCNTTMQQDTNEVQCCFLHCHNCYILYLHDGQTHIFAWKCL